MIHIAELPKLHSDPILNQLKATESLKICLIRLGANTFALDLRHVREVFEPVSITPVPGMPAAIIGVTNLRGIIVPLADVRAALGIFVSVSPKYAVVVRHGTHQVGILVEDVPEIHTIQSDDFIDHSAHAGADRGPMISDFFKIAGKVSALLEISRLLASIERMADDDSP